MATKDFEVQQLFKAYRSGVISQELFARQMDELVAGADGHDAVANVFALRSDGQKMGQHVLGKTPQTESMVFTVPPGFEVFTSLTMTVGEFASYEFLTNSIIPCTGLGISSSPKRARISGENVMCAFIYLGHGRFIKAWVVMCRQRMI